MVRRVLSITVSAVLALYLALAGAIFAPDPIHAQGGEDDYVDVAVMLEVPDTIQGSLNHDLNIIVVNRGSRTAYDVEVVVNVVLSQCWKGRGRNDGV